jgi:hypothetical protein
MALSTKDYREKYLLSDEAALVRKQLEAMMADKGYNTQPFYTPHGEELSFVEKHMTYLSQHPKLKDSEYLANLRLMTKKR